MYESGFLKYLKSVRYKKLCNTAKAPVFVNGAAAGMDVSYCQKMTYNMYCKEMWEHQKEPSEVSSIRHKFPSFVINKEEGKVQSWIAPHSVAEIHTGIAVEIPDGYCGLLVARSGIANKYGITPIDKCGIIDSDYRGELIINLSNESNQTFFLEDGMRVAQLVVVPCLNRAVIETDELSSTERGTAGMGSTGLGEYHRKETDEEIMAAREELQEEIEELEASISAKDASQEKVEVTSDVNTKIHLQDIMDGITKIKSAPLAQASEQIAATTADAVNTVCDAVQEAYDKTMKKIAEIQSKPFTYVDHGDAFLQTIDENVRKRYRTKSSYSPKVDMTIKQEEVPLELLYVMVSAYAGWCGFQADDDHKNPFEDMCISYSDYYIRSLYTPFYQLTEPETSFESDICWLIKDNPDATVLIRGTDDGLLYQAEQFNRVRKGNDYYYFHVGESYENHHTKEEIENGVTYEPDHYIPNTSIGWDPLRLKTVVFYGPFHRI